MSHPWKRIGLSLLSVAVVLVLSAAPGAAADPKEEVVATVNGNPVPVRDVREAIGIPGGIVPAFMATAEQKKQALDMEIDRRLMEQDARAQGLARDSRFTKRMQESGQALMLNALLRKEFGSRANVSEKEIREAADKLRKSDAKLPESEAMARALQAVVGSRIEKIRGDLVAEATKAFPPVIDNAVVERIRKGEKVGDNVTVATVGSRKVSVAQFKGMIQAGGGGGHLGMDPSKTPAVIESTLKQDLPILSLIEYAGSRAIGKSDAMKIARRGLESAILLELYVAKATAGKTAVTDKEIEAAYKSHKDRFVKDGKPMPLSEAKGQIRSFLEKEKARKVLDERVARLKAKAKITVNQAAMSRI